MRTAWGRMEKQIDLQLDVGLDPVLHSGAALHPSQQSLSEGLSKDNGQDLF